MDFGGELKAQILLPSHALTNQSNIQHNLDYHIHKADNQSLKSGCQSMATSTQLTKGSGQQLSFLLSCLLFLSDIGVPK